MSQAGILDVINNTPSMPITFDADVGSATAILNVIQILGGEGVETEASTNVITINLTNAFLSGTAQTVNGATANINVNIPLATNDSVANVRANITGYAKTSGIALGGELIGTVRNVGGVLSVIQIPELTKNNDAALSAWTATFTTSGTNILVQVTGVNTYTINWTAVIDFVTATEAQA